MKKTSLIILAIGLMTLSACQADIKTDTSEKKSDTTPVVTHGEPKSKGPDAPPSMDNGPDAPPPENIIDPSAQAVTTKENIRLTLPLKST